MRKVNSFPLLILYAFVSFLKCAGEEDNTDTDQEERRKEYFRKRKH